MAHLTEHTGRVFGVRSTTNLKGVHPDLVKVVTRALVLCEVDFTVIDGVRTLDQQRIHYGKGRTVKELRTQGWAHELAHRYAKPNEKKVTWTMSSLHRLQRDGFGHAVDLAHITGGVVRWQDAPLIAEAMFQAAAEEQVPLTWGKDWNRNGKAGERGETDSPHFQLHKYPGT